MGVANLSITFLFDTISDGSWNKTLSVCVTAFSPVGFNL